jgi:hypothetical protein
MRGEFISFASACMTQDGVRVCTGYRLDGAFNIQRFESCSKWRAWYRVILIERASNEWRRREVTHLPWFRHALVHSDALARYWMRGVRVDLLGAVGGFDYNH